MSSQASDGQQPKSGKSAATLKVAVSTHTFLPTVGGAELGIHEIYRRVARTHSVTVLAPLPKDTAREASQEGEREYGYRLIRFGHSARTRAMRFVDRCAHHTGIPQALALVRLARTAGVDVVNCHFLKRNALVVAAARYLLRVPVVLSLVGRPDVLATLPPVRKWRAIQVMRCSDVLVANSTFYLAKSFLADEALIIPYGVDIARFRPGVGRARARAAWKCAAEEFVILAVQRLAPVKRVDVLVRILPSILAQCPHARLVVVGTGPEEATLRALAASLQVGHAVRFCGYVEDDALPAMYGAADVFASHSEFETFGVTFAEALAAGLPIVAADSSCVKDVLATDSSVIVPADDDEAFARALIGLEADWPRRRALSVAARLRAQAYFDWESIAGQYASLLEEVVAKGRASPVAAEARA